MNLQSHQNLLDALRLVPLASIAAAMIVFGVSCSDTTATAPQPTGDVVGRVFFEDTDRTIPKVIVRIGDREYKTVTNGKFELKSIPYGEHIIIAEKGGYITQMSKIVVDAPQIEHHISLWYEPED